MTIFSTNTPKPVLSDAGFTAPSETEILRGLQADLNQAFGGGLNPALDTPQGQLARTQAAILSDYFDGMLEVFNGIDPAFASGKMQEALGRIYFLKRQPATQTVVRVQMILTNGTLPLLKAGTILATDAVSGGNLYATLQDLSFSEIQDRPVEATLACLTKGAVECPANSLLLYQGNLGISSLNNQTAGIIGMPEEGRIAFEKRRAASVAGHSMGQNAALLGALLSLSEVEEAQVIDNSENEPRIIQGVEVPPHSLYAVLVGGKAAEIGKAFLAKKPPGCATFGRQKIIVKDENPVYGENAPSYLFYFDYAEPRNIYLRLSLKDSDAVPANAADLITNVLMAYFNAPETRHRLGETIFASDLICAVKQAGSWVHVLSLSIGLTAEAGQSELTLPLNQTAVLDRQFISVTL